MTRNDTHCAVGRNTDSNRSCAAAPATRIWRTAGLLLAAISLLWCGPLWARAATESSPEHALAEMQRIVAMASARNTVWDGPTSGPQGRPGMIIAVICEDLRNGGVLGVARGVGEAANVMGWGVRMFDARGTAEGRHQAMAAALALRPDGAILVGSDAHSLERPLAEFSRRGIPLVGWHVGPRAGTMPAGNVAINVSTDPLEVGRVTAMAAIADSGGKAGVVIFTDSNFEIAMHKAETMAALIRACDDCMLLEVRRLPISQAAQLVPGVTRDLLKRYGERWTHALAINDIYFDYMAPELTRTGRHLRLFSAGDGSPSAFLRIQARLFQYGTVAEPLNLQGWQAVDELNRLLSGHPVSGYVTPAHLVTPDNIAYDGGPSLLFDPDNDYRAAYRRIWKR